MTLPWMAATITLRPVGELRPHAANARRHGAAQLDQIKASMLAFGFTNPLLIDESSAVIAGHGRLEAAQALGIAQVPVIVLRHLTPAQKDALRLADNRIALNSGWDAKMLALELRDLRDLGADLKALGFNEKELARHLTGGPVNGEGADEAERHRA